MNMKSEMRQKASEQSKLRMELEDMAITKAEGDLFFASNPWMKKLTEDEQRMVVAALKHYAAAGSTRTFDELQKRQLL